MCVEEAKRDSEGSGIVAGEWLYGLREDGNDRQEQIESRELDRCCWLSTEHELLSIPARRHSPFLHVIIACE